MKDVKHKVLFEFPKNDIGPSYRDIKPLRLHVISDTTSNDRLEKTEVKSISECKLTFKCPESMDKNEYVRQLNGQERGLNSMTIGHWRDNRENYKLNGRSLEGTVAQNIKRQQAEQSRIEYYQKNGMSYSAAKLEAQKWISTQAALHNPDQIAGGDPYKVSRMGDAKVNQSIGSQWRTRIEQLENTVNEFIKNNPNVDLYKVKMNVKLEME